MSRYTAVLEKSLGILQEQQQFIEQKPESAVGDVIAAPQPRAKQQSQQVMHQRTAFAGLIARLFSGGGTAAALKVVAFTSALPREGVSYTVRRLAEELRRATGMRVIIVAATDILVSETVGAAGAILGTPAPVAGTSSGVSVHRPKNVEDRLAALRTEHDVVLVDAGSVAGSGAIVGLAAKVDGVVIVVHSGRTDKRDVCAASDAVGVAGGKIAGFILNQQRPLLPAWLERLIG